MREQWLRELPLLDPERLVFIDESGAKTNMTRLRGRSLHGSRLFAFAPHGHYENFLFIAFSAGVDHLMGLFVCDGECLHVHVRVGNEG